MKKYNLVIGILFMLVGVVFFFAAIFTYNELDSLFSGLAGGGIGAGVTNLYKYFYAKAHGQDKEYQEKSHKKKLNCMISQTKSFVLKPANIPMSSE